MDDLFDHRSVPEYNTRAVENRTGVPADTFRAWERRYGMPHPARTEHNYRLYSERDISIILALKKMTHEGVSISHAVARLQRRIGPITDGVRHRSLPGSDLDDICRRLIHAFSAFDTRAANTLIDDARVLVDIETLCLDIIQPALVEIGDRWARGDVSIGVEHFAAAFCTRHIMHAFTASRPERGDRTVIGACVPGEQHEIGLLIVCLLLSRAGNRVVYLGADLPTAELVGAATRIRPDAIALAATSEATLDALVATVNRLGGHADSIGNPIVGYGGGMFVEAPLLRDRVDAAYLGDDARTALRTLRNRMITPGATDRSDAT